MKKSFMLSLLFSTMLALPAAAEWNTGVMRTKDGQFAYCVSESKFDNNMWLILALNPQGDVNVGVGQKGGQLPVGAKKAVAVTVDGASMGSLTAMASKPELMVINTGKDGAFLDALAKGSKLQVDAHSFPLTGSGKAVATLRECVSVNMAAAKSPAPVAAAPAPAAVAPAVVAPAPVETGFNDGWSTPAAVTPPAEDMPKAVAAAPLVPTAPVAAPGQRGDIELPPSMRVKASSPEVDPQVAAEVKAAIAAPTAPAAPVVVQPEVPVASVSAAVPAAVAPAPAPVMASAPAAVEPAKVVSKPAAPVATAEAKPIVSAPSNSISMSGKKYPSLWEMLDKANKPAEAPAAAAAPAPAPAAATAPVAQVAAAPAPVTAPAAAPALEVPPAAFTPGVRPLPEPLTRLLTAAKVRDVTPAQVTTPDVAFAWNSRDMKGNVREQQVAPGSDLVLLAARYTEALKQACAGTGKVMLGKVESAGSFQLLNGSVTCNGNGRSDYTTLVFALSQNNVLSIISHEIDQGRRAAPDRASSGLMSALKGTQG